MLKMNTSDWSLSYVGGRWVLFLLLDFSIIMLDSHCIGKKCIGKKCIGYINISFHILG